MRKIPNGKAGATSLQKKATISVGYLAVCRSADGEGQEK
jgi:hypothetical protein